MDKKRSHLKLLGSLVRRMKVGSWLLRGWSFVVVAMFLAVAVQYYSTHFASLVLGLALGSWLLDAYFLRQRRLLERLAEHVRGLDESEIDFCTDTREFDSEDEAWSTAMLAPPVVGCHGLLTAAVALVSAVHQWA